MRPAYNPAFGRGYNSQEVDDLNGKWLIAIMFSTLAASAAYGVDVEWVCIADQLNVRDDGASSGAVVDSCVYGEAMTGWGGATAEGWRKVRTPRGREGWAFAQYMMTRGAFEVLSPAVAAFRAGDNARAGALLHELARAGKAEVYPAAGGGAALVFVTGDDYAPVVIISGKAGAVACYMRFTMKAEWSPDGRYVAFDDGTMSWRRLLIFDCREEAAVFEGSVFSDNYCFAGEQAVVLWVEARRVDEEELPPDAYKCITRARLEAGLLPECGIYLPVVNAYDIPAGRDYVVAEADLDTVEAAGERTVKVSLARSEGVPDRYVALWADSPIGEEGRIETDQLEP